MRILGKLAAATAVAGTMLLTAPAANAAPSSADASRTDTGLSLHAIVGGLDLDLATLIPGFDN